MIQTLALFLGLLPQQGAAMEVKVQPELLDTFTENEASTQYRVYAVLKDRMQAGDFAGAVDGMPRKARAQHVTKTLRAYADARQGGLLSLLSELEQGGQVSRVRQLWITNSGRS